MIFSFNFLHLYNSIDVCAFRGRFIHYEISVFWFEFLCPVSDEVFEVLAVSHDEGYVLFGVVVGVEYFDFPCVCGCLLVDGCEDE